MKTASDIKNVESAEETSTIKGVVVFELDVEDTLIMRLVGSWTIKAAPLSILNVVRDLESFANIKVLKFEAMQLTEWDGRLLTFLLKVFEKSNRQGIVVERKGLPPGVIKLLDLAAAVPEKKGERIDSSHTSFFSRLGGAVINCSRSGVEMLDFIGEVMLALLVMIRGKGRFRRVDFFRTIEEVGVQALPIVSLISLLMGLILAFVGAIQLKTFGAEIYIADLVGVAMVREMAAIMTGIIVAGRTGAAFAAQLGTMEVNEETDSLRTLGISPMEFLVLPRMLALSLMMPLLCLYANIMGILGGLVVGVGVLGLNMTEYVSRTREAVGLNDLLIGIFMGLVFGILVSLAGCLRGMQCAKSSAAVGLAATSAVVTGIVSIIVATALITIITSVLGI